ncbi:MAG TPA: hypothetical protein VKU19_14435 [Bryobacteraceae bacterium]|nr:hypothetical protein [Bryobacteraceae bacterium]
MSNVRVEVLPSQVETVRLTSTTDGSFFSRAENLLTGTISAAVAVSELAPFLAIVSNQSAQMIVAYSVSFEAIGPNVRVSPQFKYPEALYRRQTTLAARDQELLPGEGRLVGPYFHLNPNMPFFTDEYLRTLGEWLRNQALCGTRELKIGLDAVIFDDGRIFGPGASTLKNSFTEHLDAVRHLHELLFESVRSGATLAEAFEQASIPLPASGAPSMSDSYANNALNSLKRLARKHGEKAIELYLQQVSNCSPIVLH